MSVTREDARYVAERARMVAEDLKARDIRDQRVLDAMGKVPRQCFVLPGEVSRAYADEPLPIVQQQTISQPLIVAWMSQAANVKPTDRCLEIGTGSGYQAAVLAELGAAVYSVEYLPEVFSFGKSNLKRAGYLGRVCLRLGDGSLGWAEHAPYDVIVVTAAPERVPTPLLEQLAVGGRLVIPVGPEHGAQALQLWLKLREGSSVECFEEQTLMAVRFVPFLGQERNKSALIP